MRLPLWAAACWLLLVPPPARADDAGVTPIPYEATEAYDPREVGGWPVLVNRAFERGEPELCGQTLELLRQQLAQIERRLPAKAVEQLRKVTIWVELDEPHHPCMVYHPDAGWLRDHGMNPDKARCVEIAGAQNFLSWTIDQPWMVLHELAHAWHHQFLDGGFENAEVKAAWQAAIDAGTFENVLHIKGRRERAYAANNPMEYFAEASEAYFGTNDFYPFVRAELQEHDPRMHDALGKLWGER
jgi:hypothetical protein